MRAWRDYVIGRLVTEIDYDSDNETWIDDEYFEIVEVRCFVLHPVRDLLPEDQVLALEGMLK